MSRYSSPPGDYQPWLKFDLRVKKEGGPLRRPGDVYAKPGALPRRECVIMVHGFNNHEGEAGTAYYGFRLRQYRRFADLSVPALEKVLADTFWPGDADWPGPIDWLDFLVYPVAVHTAFDAAPLLEDLIVNRIPGLERVYFIAHSLGCRVVLETAVLMHARGYPHIGGICLMAAAVQRNTVEPDGKFWDLLAALGDNGTHILVLHSSADPVLRFAFPPGQTLAGEGFLPVALGLKGPPPDMPGRVTSLSIDGAGHSDYWGHRNNASSEAATAAVGDFFNFGDKPRDLNPRLVGVLREVAWSRTVGK